MKGKRNKLVKKKEDNSNRVYTVWKIQPTIPVTYILKEKRGNIIKINDGFYQENYN